MGAGRHRWWRDDQRFVDECLRWVLRVEPQRHFRDFAGTALVAHYRLCEDPDFMPEIPVVDFEVDRRGDGRFRERPKVN